MASRAIRGTPKAKSLKSPQGRRRRITNSLETMQNSLHDRFSDHPITRSTACTEVRRSDHPISSLALFAMYCLIVGLFLTTSIWAQDAAPFGVITGVVKSGNVPLPGVTVGAANTLTGKKYITSTDVDGTFRLEVGSKGRYVVRAEFSAFAPITQEILI